MIHDITDIEKSISELLPKRNEQGEKRDQGCALIIAGSKDMPGAAALCTKAALRSGAGLVTLAAPRSIVPIVQAKLSEPVFISLDRLNEKCGDRESCEGCDFLMDRHVPELLKSASYQQAVAIGPGLGQRQETRTAVRNFVTRCSVPLVIDADGLNSLTPQELSLIETPCVLTPHKREFARLFGELPQDASQIPEFLAQKAKDYNKTILLKGSPIFIATPDGEIFAVPAANSGLAKGGSGDVLTGIIVAMLAQGVSAENAAVLGACLHQKAGEKAREKIGAFSMLPSDVIECLPQVFLQAYGS
ncbi:MAG: NAD(P)H-hydrate dehydratase [Fibrobacter sp.]|nr:NAD(P)H-hydrate dehydratase [Fibrobacter sp.]